MEPGKKPGKKPGNKPGKIPGKQTWYLPGEPEKPGMVQPLGRRLHGAGGGLPPPAAPREAAFRTPITAGGLFHWSAERVEETRSGAGAFATA